MKRSKPQGSLPFWVSAIAIGLSSSACIEGIEHDAEPVSLTDPYNPQGIFPGLNGSPGPRSEDLTSMMCTGSGSTARGHLTQAINNNVADIDSWVDDYLLDPGGGNAGYFKYVAMASGPDTTTTVNDFNAVPAVGYPTAGILNSNYDWIRRSTADGGLGNEEVAQIISTSLFFSNPNQNAYLKLVYKDIATSDGAIHTTSSCTGTNLWACIEKEWGAGSPWVLNNGGSDTWIPELAIYTASDAGCAANPKVPPVQVVFVYPKIVEYLTGKCTEGTVDLEKTVVKRLCYHSDTICNGLNVYVHGMDEVSNSPNVGDKYCRGSTTDPEMIECRITHGSNVWKELMYSMVIDAEVLTKWYPECHYSGGT